MATFGRTQIFTNVQEVTLKNLPAVLSEAITVHSKNANEIEKLWKYTRGDQPILHRVKDVRPEINNKVVENHAYEIEQFWSGWLMGEPCTYVRRGSNESASSDIETLNNYMFSEEKDSLDEELATWLCVCGVGYRMILPDKAEDMDDAPFELDVPDPQSAFVVYSSGFGRKPMIGCLHVNIKKENGMTDDVYFGYTRTHSFKYVQGQVLDYKPHALGYIPIIEYTLDKTRMGVFEPVIGMLDAINTTASNREDGIEQFVQSFVKFVNCDIDEETFTALRQAGAIKIKSTDGNQADVEILSQELNQMQTQTLVDYMYQVVLAIAGVPTTNRTGGGSSDNGVAVQLRQGWEQSEARARKYEKNFKKSERQFLKVVLRILRGKEIDYTLRLIDIDIKFSRRNTDNLLTKTQALLNMLNAGISPEEAIATCGLWNDPVDVYQKSKDFLKKWEYSEPAPATENTA